MAIYAPKDTEDEHNINGAELGYEINFRDRTARGVFTEPLYHDDGDPRMTEHDIEIMKTYAGIKAEEVLQMAVKLQEKAKLAAEDFKNSIKTQQFICSAYQDNNQDHSENESEKNEWDVRFYFPRNDERPGITLFGVMDEQNHEVEFKEAAINTGSRNELLGETYDDFYQHEVFITFDEPIKAKVINVSEKQFIEPEDTFQKNYWSEKITVTADLERIKKMEQEYGSLERKLETAADRYPLMLPEYTPDMNDNKHSLFSFLRESQTKGEPRKESELVKRLIEKYGQETTEEAIENDMCCGSNYIQGKDENHFPISESITQDDAKADGKDWSMTTYKASMISSPSKSVYEIFDVENNSRTDDGKPSGPSTIRGYKSYYLEPEAEKKLCEFMQETVMRGDYDYSYYDRVNTDGLISPFLETDKGKENTGRSLMDYIQGYEPEYIGKGSSFNWLVESLIRKYGEETTPENGRWLWSIQNDKFPDGREALLSGEDNIEDNDIEGENAFEEIDTRYEDRVISQQKGIYEFYRAETSKYEKYEGSGNQIGETEYSEDTYISDYERFRISPEIENSLCAFLDRVKEQAKDDPNFDVYHVDTSHALDKVQGKDSRLPADFDAACVAAVSRAVEYNASLTSDTGKKNERIEVK